MLIQKPLGVAGMVAAALLLNGCGGDTHDSLMQESIAEMKKMVAAMKQVKDKDTAAAQASTFKAIGENMKSLKARADKLPKLSADEEKAMEAKFKADLEPIVSEMMTEGFRVMALGPDVQAQLQAAMEPMKDLQ